MAITYTPNYNLSMDDTTHGYDVERVNANTQKIDTALKANADAIGDIATLLDAINGEVI